ncbi:peptidoglycan recognition protein family protein [Pseudomonas fildesensis]|uniref:Lysozyme n=1 Tax=Pseudomonas fildesensis TaxID=1674920 RepID=A0A0J8FUQ3_9PSED|nr:N-acetylmuramoyl-L-alanine amidase [Pseudomonas fildesensis]KMT52429.1 lysozyme [Pseudomonas fildesensis]
MARVQFKQRSVTRLLVIHCAATRPSMDIGLREIRQWHVQQGWLDVGYHYIIRRDGTVEVGRPHDAVGSHVKGHNSESVGVCLVGGVDDNLKPQDNFTDAQWKALDLLVWETIVPLYPGVTLTGHRDLDPGKACPSFDVAAWAYKRTPA